MILTKKGDAASRNFTYELKVNGIIKSTASFGVLTDLSEGIYKIEGKVTDKRGASSTDVEEVLVKTPFIKTEFGAKFQGKVAEQLVVLKEINAQWTRTGGHYSFCV